MNDEVKKPTSSFLVFMATGIFTVGSCLTLSSLMSIKLSFLNDVTVLLVKTIATLASVILLTLACYFKKKEDSGITLINCFKKAALAMLIYAVLALIRTAIFRAVIQHGETKLLYYLPYIVCCLLQAYFTVQIIYSIITDTSFLTSFRLLWKKFFNVPLYLLLMLVFAFALSFKDQLFTVFSDYYFFTITGALAVYLIEGIIGGICFNLLINKMSKACKDIDQKKTEGNKKPVVRMIVYTIAAAALLVVNVFFNRLDYVETIMLDITPYLAKASSNLHEGNIDVASYNYRLSCNHKKSWLHLISDESMSYEVEDLIDDTYPYVLRCISKNDIGSLERYITWKDDRNLKVQGALLYLYSKSDSSDKPLAKEIALNLAANGNYQENFICLDHLSEKQVQQLKEKLELLNDADGYNDLLMIIRSSMIDGDVVSSWDAFKIAEKYSDDYDIQAMVIGYIIPNITDHDSRLDELTECISRFVELTTKETSITEQQRNGNLIYAYNAYVRIGQYQHAYDMLDKIKFEEGNNIRQTNEIYLLDKLGRHAESYQLALQLANNGQGNTDIYFYAALGAIKVNDYKSALENYVKLADIVKTSKDVSDEQSLFLLSEYITLNDNASYTDFTYNFFNPEMEEEYYDVLKQDEFANNYLNAVYYGKIRDFEDKVEPLYTAIIKENDHLPYINYLMAISIYDNRVDNKAEALPYYQRAIELDDSVPVFWYGYATTLDNLERYEEAYQACLRCKALIDVTNHEKDWYGVGIHNNYLLNRLEEELNKEGK